MWSMPDEKMFKAKWNSKEELNHFEITWEKRWFQLNHLLTSIFLCNKNKKKLFSARQRDKLNLDKCEMLKSYFFFLEMTRHTSSDNAKKPLSFQAHSFCGSKQIKKIIHHYPLCILLFSLYSNNHNFVITSKYDQNKYEFESFSFFFTPLLLYFFPLDFPNQGHIEAKWIKLGIKYYTSVYVVNTSRQHSNTHNA